MFWYWYVLFNQFKKGPQVPIKYISECFHIFLKYVGTCLNLQKLHILKGCIFIFDFHLIHLSLLCQSEQRAAAQGSREREHGGSREPARQGRRYWRRSGQAKVGKEHICWHVYCFWRARAHTHTHRIWPKRNTKNTNF